MGFFRGGLVFVLGVILLLSLIVGNVFFVISSSLKYENVQKNINPFIKETITETLGSSNFEQSFQSMKDYCLISKADYYKINQDGFFEDISCEDILAKNSSAIIDGEVENFIQKTYYKEYDCSFFECLKESNGLPLFFISKSTKDYFQSKFYLALIFLLVLVVLMFFLSEEKKNFPIVLGSLVILSSLPFMKIDSLPFAKSDFSQVLFIFVSSSKSVFWAFLILGIVIIALGVFLKFWKFDKIGKSEENLSDNKPIQQKKIQKNKKKFF
jgi:hypothetical protein